MTHTPDELERVLIPIDIVRAAVDAALQTVKRARWEPEERQAAEAIANAVRSRLDDRTTRVHYGLGKFVTHTRPVTPAEVQVWAAEGVEGSRREDTVPMLRNLLHRLDVIAAQLPHGGLKP